MGTVLVTGSTGTLGRQLVPILGDRGHEVRTLSRAPGRGTHVGDLATGRGVLAAAAGAELIVHAASDIRHFGRADRVQTRHLLDAATRAHHLLYVSIVGNDTIPYGYFRRKAACEDLLAIHRVPYTILRATQFHELMATLVHAVQRLPVAPLPLDFQFQPVAARDVANRIADLIGADPMGRAADFGGAEVLSLAEMVHTWRTQHGRPKRMVRLPVPGQVGRAFRQGRNTCPEHRDGVQTWEEFVTAAPGSLRGQG
jgi:uncharacterized protein YbjT (DUF2867 family)